MSALPTARPAAQPLEGRGDVEPALVERLAGDDPAQSLDLGERADVVEIGHSPARDHRDGCPPHRRRQPVDVGPAEHAVAVDVRDDERRGRGEQLVDVVEVATAADRPAVHGEFATTVVEPDRHRQDCRRVGDDARLAHRRRAHHHAGDTEPGQLRNVVHGPDAATGLHLGGRADRGDDRRHDRPVDRIARLGGVEIDDMDPGRSRGGEVAGDRDRVVAVDRLVVVVAGAQPHDPAAEQIDGGIEVDHAALRQTSTKLLSSRRPGRLDFSGWNWAAKTLPERNAALIVVPYSTVAATTSGSSGTPCKECTK